MRWVFSVVAATTLSVLVQPALARPGFNALISATTDDRGGNAQDADVSVTHPDWWEVGAGGSSTKSQSTFGESHSTSQRGHIDLHSNRLGLRSYVQRWRAAPYELGTAGARGYIIAAPVRFGVIGEAKNLDVEYLANRFTGETSVKRYNGHGWGLAADYRHERWFFYASAIKYRYPELSEYLRLQAFNLAPQGGAGPSGGPGTTSGGLTGPGNGELTQMLGAPPPLSGTSSPGLSYTVMSLSQGAYAYYRSAGVAYDIERSTLYADWVAVKELIAGHTTNYYSASYSFRLGNIWYATATAGSSRSYYGPSTYGSLALGVSF